MRKNKRIIILIMLILIITCVLPDIVFGTLVDRFGYYISTGGQRSRTVKN